MTAKQQLHEAIDGMSEEEIHRLIRVVEVFREERPGIGRVVDLTPYSGIIRLSEDALTYQKQIRNEWP